ncbi:MAG: hypothetical protein ACI9HK_004682 [Pirellulaceae bacterium]|jgi:hypothetical protein
MQNSAPLIGTARVVEGDFRICNVCGESHPTSEFRMRDIAKGVRHGNCRACFNDEQKDRRDRRRTKSMTVFVDTVDDDQSLTTNSRRVSRVEAMANAMLAQVGGVAKFADMWHQLIQLSIDQDKTHLAVKAMDGLTKLVMMCHEKEVERMVPFGEMSDGDLESETCEWVLRHVWQDPYIAASVLEAQGWAVEAPLEIPSDTPSFAEFAAEFAASRAG